MSTIQNIDLLNASILNQILPLVYVLLTILIIVVIILLIVDRISRDRVIKLFSGSWVVLFHTDEDGDGVNEAYYGKMIIPTRSSGGFEILFPVGNIENPHKIIGYLVRVYRETGKRIYLERAAKLHKLVYGFEKESFEDVDYSPFDDQPLASKKVYRESLKNVISIVRFIDDLPEILRIQRAKELSKIYHPNIYRRLVRGITNLLGLIKDKLKEALGYISATVSSISPVDVGKPVSKVGEEAIKHIGATYNALLEASIGELVKVLADDIDGSKRFYSGILREYSQKYLAIYNVDFIIPVESIFDVKKGTMNYKVLVNIHGWSPNLSKYISVALEDNKIILKCLSGNLLVDKVYFNNEEINLSGKKLRIGDAISIPIPSSIKLEDLNSIKFLLRVARVADVIWPINRAVVIGSGEPKLSLISDIIDRFS